MVIIFVCKTGGVISSLATVVNVSSNFFEYTSQLVTKNQTTDLGITPFVTFNLNISKTFKQIFELISGNHFSLKIKQ